MSTITLHPTDVDREVIDPAVTRPGIAPDEVKDDPRWARPCLIALLAGTAVLYLWGLGASGWANGFYSAAAQAGAKSWKAFFFGSFDSSNAITVDKPPAALWVMSLSVRLFGLNAWSILVPQALEGVAAVGLLYATVRRWFGAGAGLLAGLVLATTPVAALMFRFNNPDALLTVLLVGAAYAMVRALERAQTRWLVIAATLIGFGFLTKMLQAFVIVPGFILVYLIAAPTPVRRRLWQLALSAVALAVASFWWVVVVMAIPASSRPYIGGSQNNSVWDLIFGYNGLGRITGNETGSVGGGGQGGTSMWGPTGITRMFNTEFGGQIAWLLPAALLLLVVGAVATRRAARRDRTRSALILWGSWLLVTGVLFSLSEGIIHPYYTVALAPAIGAIIGVGVTKLWRARGNATARSILAVLLAATALWSSVLLQRASGGQPWLQPVIVVAGLVLSAALLIGPWLEGRLGKVIGSAAIVVGLLGAGSYTLATAATTHSGAIPSAGPSGATGFGFRGGRGPIGGQAFPGGGAFRPGGGGGGGGAGGLLEASAPSAELTNLLETDASSYTWVAAAVGSNSAAGYQLATEQPVMSIGGFNGTDPSPTLAEFQADVASGQIHYFIAGGGFGGGFGGRGGGASTSSSISSWVESNFTATTVAGVTLYDLTT